jgi:hypothetical protein
MIEPSTTRGSLGFMLTWLGDWMHDAHNGKSPEGA